MKILVLGGGNSGERAVSLRSSAAVREALVKLGHEVSFVDPADGDDAVRRAAADCELVLPILHGVGGEDGVIQRLLDETGRPYLGSGVAASELCFDKRKTKELLRRHGVRVPAEAVVTAESFAAAELRQRPFVLKPVRGGSSLDTFIVRELPGDEAAMRAALAKYGGGMLLEELVEGVELTAAVLGDEALPVVEIIPPEGGVFDYENKYNGATTEACPPLHISEAVQAQARALALRVHELAGARHLSRTDMILAPSGELFVLEINTLPGMTNESLFPKAAKAAGLAWEQLVARLVELALS